MTSTSLCDTDVCSGTRTVQMAMHSIKVTSLFFVLQLATAVAVPPAAEGTGTQTLDLGGRWTCTNGTGTPVNMYYVT